MGDSGRSQLEGPDHLLEKTGGGGKIAAARFSTSLNALAPGSQIFGSVSMTDVVATSNDPVPEFGPAMRALHTKWQRAVLALFQTRGNMTAALEIAGYKADNRNSIKATAWKIFHDDRVRAAVREVAGRMIETSEPELLATTFEIMRDAGTDTRDRLAAVRMVWDRANPVLTKHKIEVEHHLSSDELDLQHYRALQKLGAPQQAFLDRFGVNGLDRVQAMVALEDAKHKQIETDYHEVIDGER